jgi:hypothetical protein
MPNNQMHRSMRHLGCDHLSRVSGESSSCVCVEGYSCRHVRLLGVHTPKNLKIFLHHGGVRVTN